VIQVPAPTSLNPGKLTAVAPAKTTLLQQLLLELRVRDDALLNQQLRECIVWASVASMSSSNDTGLLLSSSAIATPI